MTCSDVKKMVLNKNTFTMTPFNVQMYKCAMSEDNRPIKWEALAIKYTDKGSLRAHQMDKVKPF